MAGLGGQELVIVLVILLIWVGPAVLVYQDAKRRGASAVGWLVGGLVGGLITLIVWLIVRPPRMTNPHER